MKFDIIRKLPGLYDFRLASPDVEIGQLFYDSRLITGSADGTFFAFRSERSDGHRFIPDLLASGVNRWIISDESWFRKLSGIPGNSVALTDNPLQILSGLAALHRSRFQFPVIAITGSNGKTIVKEWLSQLLECRYSVCRNPKSFNSQIGVPLSVWNLHSGHNLGIFEAGISRKGEMDILAGIIRPDSGIFTNLGAAHREGFDSEIEKLREKLRLFKSAAQLVLPQKLLEENAEVMAKELPDIEFLPWSWQLLQEGVFRLHFRNMTYDFRLPFSDDASLENLGNCIAMAILQGLSEREIAMALPGLNQPEMRLSLKAGRYGNLLIDDSYTNEPNGLEAALQFAHLQRKPAQELVLIISDLEGIQGGPAESSLLLRDKLQKFSVNRLISIGSQFASVDFSFLNEHRNFADLNSLLQSVKIMDFRSSVILVKGSRRFGLERLINAWQEKVHGTYLEINLDALVHNLNHYRSALPSGTGIMAIVKASGYGSGDVEIARLLEFHRVDYLAVAYADEGIKLREAGISLPIMVMNPAPDSMDVLLQYRLEPEIYSFRILEAFEDAVKRHDSADVPAIHLKVDTGMHRLGFLMEQCNALIARLKELNLTISTAFSHLAAAENPALSDFTLGQIRCFDAFCSELTSSGLHGFRRHILNSAGILRFPQASYEMVRLGIGLYGVESNPDFQARLRPVSRLKTIVSQIKNIPAGASVGYGRMAFLQRDSRVATIAIGYSDGFRRAFSAGALALRYKNLELPVLGNVCMDMCMIDATGTDLEEGMEITIFETAEDIHRLASASSTIPYEILTGIGHRVKRIYYRE